MLIKDSFLLTQFFFFYAIKYWKIRKTIFTQCSPLKQIERYCMSHN